MRSDLTPSVATVVVTYNGLEATIACLDSLLETSFRRHEIVVVDNGSTGEAAAIAARYGSRVATLRPSVNLGFGGGANLGIRWAQDRGADYVWVLNNDTLVRPDTIERLVAAMEDDPRIGIASPQISSPEGPEAPGGVWFAGGVVNLARGSTRHLLEPLPAGEVADSAFLTGCALMLRSRTLIETDLFWERLFLYWEDTDLVLRARELGWRTCVVADAWLHHDIHGATPNAVVAYYHFRNAVLVAWRHGGLKRGASAAGYLAVQVSRRWASSALRRRPVPMPETRGLIGGAATAVRWSVRAPNDAHLRPTGPRRSVRQGDTVTDRKPAILHVVRRYSPMLGGTETYVRDLAEAQARLGHRVTVLTLDRDVTGVMPGRLPESAVQEGVRVVRLPGFGARRFALTTQPWRLVREIRRADVVHVHDIRFMTGLTCATTRIVGRPFILHTHGLIFHTQWAARLKRLLMRAYFGPILRLAGASIVASSGADRETLVALCPYLAPRASILQNAIRLGPLLALPRNPVPGRVLAFGRVARSKSLDRLLAALALVDIQAWELWIAGPADAGEKARLEAVSSDLGIRDRVRFLGPWRDEEFGQLVSQADAAAFPSPGEGFGLALLEAMASGVPVLANDIPAHRELLGPDLAGQLIDFEQADAAAADLTALLRMSLQSKLELGRTEQSRAAQFDIDRLARDIEALYRSLGVRS